MRKVFRESVTHMLEKWRAKFYVPIRNLNCRMRQFVRHVENIQRFAQVSRPLFTTKRAASLSSSLAGSRAIHVSPAPTHFWRIDKQGSTVALARTLKRVYQSVMYSKRLGFINVLTLFDLFQSSSTIYQP